MIVNKDNNIYMLKEGFKQNDYRCMITVKFMVHQESREIINNFNKIVRKFNKKIFCKENEHLLGLVVIEKNSEVSANRFHIHMLLLNNKKLSKFTEFELMDMFIKSSERLKNEADRKLFVHNNIGFTINTHGVSGLKTDCCHIEKVYFSDGAIDYVTMDTNYEADNLLFLEKHGINYCDVNFSIL